MTDPTSLGFRKALYYPNIEPENQWLANALLIWDEIYTIVPRSMSVPYRTDAAQEYASAGILKSIRVSSESPEVEAAGEESKRVTWSPITDALRQLSEPARIHRGKIPSSWYGGLREVKAVADGDREWIQMHKGEAALYMTILAQKVAQSANLPLLTDDAIAEHVAGVAARGTELKNTRLKLRHERMTAGIVTSAVFKWLRVSGRTGPDKVLKFRTQRRSELLRLRRLIAQIIASLQSGDMTPSDIEQFVHDEIGPKMDELRQSLRDHRISFVNDTLMRVSAFSASATQLPVALLGLSMPQMVVATAALTVASSAVAYGRGRRESLQKSPVSYLLSAEHEFAKKSAFWWRPSNAEKRRLAADRRRVGRLSDLK